jgi:hypothetical protein
MLGLYIGTNPKYKKIAQDRNTREAQLFQRFLKGQNASDR